MGFVITTVGHTKWTPFYYTGLAGTAFLSTDPQDAQVFADQEYANLKAKIFNGISLDGRVYEVIPQPRPR